MSADRQGLFDRFEKAIEKYCPDPLLFAIFLTVVMLVLVLLFTDTGPGESLAAWGNGLHGLLAFTMQMCLMVVTAHVLVHTGPVERLLHAVGRIPNNAWQAYLVVVLCAAAFSLACWSLGLIAGGLIAREVATTAHRRNIPINYPLLASAAFGGFVVWEMGYSSSVGLTVATPGNPLEQTIGGIIPVTDTLLSWWNLLTIVTTLSVVYLAVMLLAKRRRSDLALPPPGPEKAATGQDVRPGLMGRLESGRSISLLLALMLFSYLAYWFAARGFELSLNVVNWSFLALGLLLARSILHYSALFANGARVAAPLLLQYPLYGGIMGLALETGLAEQVTNLVISSASSESLPFAGFLSAGLINIFIPSGGGQWAVQGPVFIQAAQALDVKLSLITMSIAWGDQWTNLIQPFCAIVILAITGLKLREIYGYCCVICLATAFPFILGLWLAQ